MVFFQDTRCLTEEVIDAWSEQAEQAYRKTAGKRAESTTKLRLSLEEILLRFRTCYGTDTVCQIRGIRRFSGIRFELAQSGAPRNPLFIEPDMAVSYDILARMNINPQYVYREGRNLNVVTVPAPLKPRKNAMLLGVALGVAFAVLTWLFSGLLPDAVRNDYLIPLISGLFGKLSAVFSTLATPLVFCAVISGISGIGDVSSFGKLGGRLLSRMMLTYGIAMTAMLAVGLPQGLVTGGGSSGGENVFSDLLRLVLDIIPGNLIEPFRIDNDLQVIVIAIFIGLIMLALGDKVRQLRVLLDEAGNLFNRMMLTVCKLLPLFVYLGFSNLLLGGRFSELANVSKIIVVFLPGAAITIGITVARTLIITKRPFRWLFTAQAPALLINLTTSSQVSALPESMKCCKERWGIDEKFTNFGLPLGIVIYMPNGAILHGTIAWVLSAASTGTVDPVTLGKIVFVAVIVDIAAPPIPGAAITVLPILFSACGVDVSMMPLAVLVASTLGYLLPAMNGYCLQLELLMSAWKSDRINKSTA